MAKQLNGIFNKCKNNNLKTIQMPYQNWPESKSWCIYHLWYTLHSRNMAVMYMPVPFLSTQGVLKENNFQLVLTFFTATKLRESFFTKDFPTQGWCNKLTMVWNPSSPESLEFIQWFVVIVPVALSCSQMLPQKMCKKCEGSQNISRTCRRKLNDNCRSLHQGVLLVHTRLSGIWPSNTFSNVTGSNTGPAMAMLLFVLDPLWDPTSD